jgi:hypothetical protein
MTSAKIQVDPSWKRIKLGKISRNCFIYLHPDLEHTVASNNDLELHLLGYILDPRHPEYSNQNILDELLRKSSIDAIAAATDTLTGKFVLIYNQTDSIKVLHDPTGLRELYYYNNDKEFACGSTSNIIADFLSVDFDNEREINYFFHSPEFNKNKKWLGTRTIYKGIMKLLPNHYLDLLQKRTYRYWPREERRIVEIDKATRHAADILTGTYESILRRCSIQQTLTSGWDTRLLLAACRKNIDKIDFYFIRGFKADSGLAGSMDYLITKKIADQYNLSMQYYVPDGKVDEEFERIFYFNNLFARPNLLWVYDYVYRNNLENITTVCGTEGNVFFRLKSDINRNIDQPVDFARKYHYQGYSYVINSLAEWINELKDVRKMGYYALDMFYWEQSLGILGASLSTEQNIVRDELRPFNNRELVSTLGQVADKYRYKDYPLNYVKTIKLLWPEILNFNNDVDNLMIKKALRVINLERWADKVYQRIKA